MYSEYGIKQTGDPRVLSIIGRERALHPREKQILRHLNLSLHRIEVMPYDLLAKRAETQLSNLRRILSVSGTSAEEGPE